jgi:hypothetical protein
MDNDEDKNVNNVKQIYLNTTDSTNSNINDIRGTKDFQNVTFSKFKRSEVLKELLKNLINSKVEDSCYWCIELICSGHFKQLWELFVDYYTTYIHSGNVKISIYLEKQHQKFQEIAKQGYQHDVLSLRNNSHIRGMFGEIIYVLCVAKKKHCFSMIKLDRMDYDWIHLKELMKAPNLEFVEHLLLQEDPQSLLMPLNEFAYHIHAQHKNTMEACYWVEWILGFDAQCHPKLKCERRVFAPVESTKQMDVVWMIWGALLAETKQRQLPLIAKIVHSLLYLFGIHYTSTSFKKKKNILYFAICILCDPLDLNEAILPPDKMGELETVKDNIDYIYRQIKHNEEAPDMDYLYQNKDTDKNRKIKKTLDQLEQLDQLDATLWKNK